MISTIYLGSPINDFSTDGSSAAPQFYLISIFNQPYRVIYTRYPYHYLKRLIRRRSKGKANNISFWCSKDIINAFVEFLPEKFRASFLSIQPIYMGLSNNERTKPLTKNRIRETIAVLESYYVSSALFPLF